MKGCSFFRRFCKSFSLDERKEEQNLFEIAGSTSSRGFRLGSSVVIAGYNEGPGLLVKPKILARSCPPGLFDTLVACLELYIEMMMQ